MAQKKLYDQVSSYWNSRDLNGRKGLFLLDEAIRRAASKDRDWDALANFVARAKRSNSKQKVFRIIRGAFGNSLTMKADKDHPTGLRFTMDWEGAFPLEGSNTYGFVAQHIEHKGSWDDAEFLKELGKALPDKPKAAPKTDDRAHHNAAKHIANYMIGKRRDGLNIETILAEAKALFQAEVAQKAG